MNLKSALPLLLAASFLGASGAPTDGPFSWAQAQGADLIQQNSICAKDTLGLGLGLGQWTTAPHWGWEATYLHSQLESKGNLWMANEDHLDGSLLYRPWTGTRRWIPFLRAGAGFTRLEAPLSLGPSSTIRLNLLAGAGTQVLLGTQGLGSLEVRSVTVQTSTRHQELELVAGLGLRWGGRPAAAALPATAPLPAPTPAPVMAAPVPPPAVVPVPAPAPAPAPAAAPVPPPVPAVAVALPAKFVLGEAVLHFPNNGDVLGVEAVSAIQTVAAQLKGYPGEYTLQIGGHTSSLGSPAHNKALSLRRAQAVARILVDAGIPVARITTKGAGADQPIADNRTREGQSRNRRVEIDVSTPEAVEKTRTQTGTVEAPAATKPSPK